MKSKFITKRIDYDGSQLRSHYIYDNFAIDGDAIVSFIGGCDVNEHMVDLEDKQKREFIFSESMLHFLTEHFDNDLEKTIMRKRLLVSIIMEEINGRIKRMLLVRRGNGLYTGERKLNVAVATASPVSTLIHVGVNISAKNTPVKTIGLDDLKIKPAEFANTIMKRYIEEIKSIEHSRSKVKGVS